MVLTLLSSRQNEVKNMITTFLSERGAYAALADMIVKSGLSFHDVKADSNVFAIRRRGEMKGYGVRFCGHIVREG